MAKSVYFPQFGGVKSEQSLVQDLVDEQIKLFGMDVYYIPRILIKDEALNDVVLSKYKQFYTIEMMLLNVEGFGGSASLEMSKFGLKISDEISFAVSRRRWQTFAATTINTTVTDRPCEGDLIYIPMTQNAYEIKYVEREAPFYQLGKNYIFAMNCELMQRSDNEFNTGVEEIDDLQQDDYVIPITLKAGGSGTFIKGEIVEQTYTKNNTQYTTTAEVAKWNLPSRVLEVVYVDGTFQQNVALVGEESGASWIVETFSTIEFDTENYQNNQNEYFEEQGDTLIDFTEDNPFGEYGDMGVF
jgi:hypothetical protein